jgi:uncharacterized protein (TIGR00730 family)
MLASICVFTAARPGARPAYADAVRDLARELARRRLRIVYGGGRTGLMGVLADEALARGAEVVGVIPQALVEREAAHLGLSALEVVSTLHERKAVMAQRADAFVGAPGGIGTLEELVEALSWAQLGLHGKPCGLLNVGGYYDRLLGWLDHAVDEGFVPAGDRALLTVAPSAPELLDALSRARPGARRRP